MIAIHQFVPTITRHDAIGHHVLELRELLRGLGVASEIFADERHGDLGGVVRPAREYVAPGDRTALLYHAATASPLAAFLMGRPELKIIDYHNVTPARFFTGWDAGLAAALRAARREIARIVPRADVVVAHSRFSARDIEDWGHRHPIIVPVLGDSILDPSAPELLPTPPGHEVRRWLFVGRLAPNKAQEQLIKALALFRRTYAIPVELHLVGAASPRGYGDALVRLADEAGVADLVSFHAGLPAAELTAMYRSADVFVSASAHEGYCVPVVEAMGFGLPVVARAAGAIPETAGGAAVLVPGDAASTIAVAVHRVLTDSRLRDQLVAAGRARAAEIAARERGDYERLFRGIIERLT